ncbi:MULTISPECIES: class II aldolase/adducin family protein [Pseudomonas]|jgi:ribulose-5-phosphate 4-epimerase/fuculose-1-phosphate aldolase|uniref:class II aldolase/adducin family protein n=1 Tax=Pseudomonas TaxID=286 RepID=UPI000CFF554A|nr:MULTISPECIES: class II aldolase/adducin family protein [Pseudomonas]PRA53775.1 ribulose phosphate epimerase [Pseudomonas sp. MYb115]QXN48186.1 class II aldolase/adducin family protein [Pseudomonas fluorescens]WSO22496.1 class II aldolase/adducin family protein [Pseudomonas fluorescens]
MTVLIHEQLISEQLQAFIDQVLLEAEEAFTVFRETNTITANGTVGFIERVPGEELLVSINYGGPWNYRKPLQATVTDFAGKVIYGKGKGGQGRYTKLFQTHPDITTVSHVHSPYLGAWAQTHRTLPFHYVPVQRYQLARELPVYIDRRQAEVDFILDKIAENPFNLAILEANGGSTVWGKQGLRATAQFILLLEEGAQLQLLADALGGSRAYGPGVLTQQWKMSGLFERATELGLVPAIDRRD